MQCLPGNLTGRVYYRPTSEGAEKRIAEHLQEIKRRRSQAGKGVPPVTKTESGA
jgi:putative ATPase